MEACLKVYSDGASRGNPGPSAIAFLVVAEEGKILTKCSRYSGVGTNNQAEYEALISALQSASRLSARKIVCHLDSQLVVKQLNGEYRVRSSRLKILWQKVRSLKKVFQEVSFVYLPRTNHYIELVDRMANQALDQVD